MCRHLGAQPNCPEGQPGQEAKREVDYLLTDMADGLDLSRKLLLLAEGPWEECGHGGRLPIQGILRDCAHKIVTETMRCRMELETRGTVHFGSVAMEDGGDLDGPDLAAAPLWGGPPLAPIYPQHPSGRSGSRNSQAVLPIKAGDSPLGTLRRLCAAFLVKNAPGRPILTAEATRQGGA
jgi:hypothetical protein